jgi:general stress protein YciG
MEKQKRGFACMSLEKRRAIAAKGGASVPDEKRAFSVDRTLAAVAGRKGGEAGKRKASKTEQVLTP